MGAVGALQLAFTHPDVFGVVGAHSPSLREDDGSVPFLGTGEEWASRDPLSLVPIAPRIDHLKIWIDIGQDDVYYERAEELLLALQQRGLEPAPRPQAARGPGDW